MGAGHAGFVVEEGETVDAARARDIAGDAFYSAEAFSSALSTSSSSNQGALTATEWNDLVAAFVVTLRTGLASPRGGAVDEVLRRPGLSERFFDDEVWYFAVGSLQNVQVMHAHGFDRLVSLPGEAPDLRTVFQDSDAVGLPAGAPSGGSQLLTRCVGIAHKMPIASLPAIDACFVCLPGVERRRSRVRLRRLGGSPVMVDCFVHCVAPDYYSTAANAASSAVDNLRAARPEARLVEIMIQAFFHLDHTFFREDSQDHGEERGDDLPFSVHLRELRSLSTAPRPGPHELLSFSWKAASSPPIWTDQDVHEANVRAAASPGDVSFFMCVNGKVLRWAAGSSIHTRGAAEEPPTAASPTLHSSELAKVLLRAITEAPSNDDDDDDDDNDCDDCDDCDDKDEGSDTPKPPRLPPAKSSSSSLSRSSQASMFSILEVAERSQTAVDYEVFACRSQYDPRFGVERSAEAMGSEQRGLLEHGLVSSPFGRFFEMVAVAAPRKRRSCSYGGRRGDDEKAADQEEDCRGGGGGNGSGEFKGEGEDGVAEEVKTATIDAVD